MSKPTHQFRLYRILMNVGNIMKVHHIHPDPNSNELSENIQTLAKDLHDFLNERLTVLKSKKSRYERYTWLVACIRVIVTDIEQNPTDISHIQKFVNFVQPKEEMLDEVDRICNEKTVD